MSAYKIIVNDVQKTENSVLCLARIDNYQNMMKRVSVGESIRTDPFPLHFRSSIGVSSWILIFYPKGQYIESSNFAVVANGRASMYLKMVRCEHESHSLPMAIKFFFKSPYCDVMDEFSSTKYATFSYCNWNQRWIGPFHMASTKELYSNECKKLFLNDSLTVGCELHEVTFPPCMSPPMIRSNENVHTTSRSYTKDKRSLTVGYESKDITVRPCVPVLQSKENRNTAIRRSFDVKFNNVDAILPQPVSRVSSKGNLRRATTSNAAVCRDVSKENKNQERVSIQLESTLASGSDPVNKEEKEHFCKCRSSDEMICKQTQTWSEILRSNGEKTDKKQWRSVGDDGANNATHSPSCRRVKAKVEFFEKCFLSKD